MEEEYLPSFLPILTLINYIFFSSNEVKKKRKKKTSLKGVIAGPGSETEDEDDEAKEGDLQLNSSISYRDESGWRVGNPYQGTCLISWLEAGNWLVNNSLWSPLTC